MDRPMAQRYFPSACTAFAKEKENDHRTYGQTQIIVFATYLRAYKRLAQDLRGSSSSCEQNRILTQPEFLGRVRMLPKRSLAF